MDRPVLYDDDILAWSEQQAAALRGIAARRDLPNDLDLRNIVEEIESVGRSELGRAESLIAPILEHVAKAVSDPEAQMTGHWRTECVGWHAQLQRAFAPSMRQRIDMAVLWRRALRVADAALAEHDQQLAPKLAGPCPVSLDDLLAETFELRDVVRRIAAT